MLRSITQLSVWLAKYSNNNARRGRIYLQRTGRRDHQTKIKITIKILSYRAYDYD